MVVNEKKKEHTLFPNDIKHVVWEQVGLGLEWDGMVVNKKKKRKKKNIPCCQMTQNMSFGNRWIWSGMRWNGGEMEAVVNMSTKTIK